MSVVLDDTMVDPDPQDNTKYSWDEEFQRHIAALLVSDRQFLLQSLDLVKPSYFTNKAHTKIVSIASDFFKKYRILPRKDFIVQELKTQLKENKSLPYYLGEVTLLFDYFQPGMEARDYLQDKITYFAKIQSLKQAFHKSLELIDKAPEDEDTWESIYDKMRDAMTTHQNFEVGCDYFKSTKDRYAKMAEDSANDERFITGLSGVDLEINGGGYRRGQMISIVAGSGVGKCFSKNTLVLMFDGTVKMVQNVQVGDLVMGDDSTARKVLRTHSGIDQMYDVIPVKGDKYTVNSRHTLLFKSCSMSLDKKNRCINHSYSTSPYRQEDGVFAIEVKDYLEQSNHFKSCMKGYRVGVDFPEQKVKIDPYVLGVWLGDGTSRCADFTTADAEIVSSLKNEAEFRNLRFWRKEDRGLASVYAIVSQNQRDAWFKANTLLNDIKEYDLLNNKHVPDVYKNNSREVRLQVLAGLIDTDGSKSNNCFDFINKNKALAEDVLFLARSLGMAAYMKSSFKKCQGFEGNNYWRVTISGNTHEVPVRLPRKKCEPRGQIKDVLQTGIKVVPVGEGQYFGFETDGNHRFMLGDFTVVHNSVMLACISATNLLRGKKGVYITLEISEEMVAERMDSILTGFPIQSLQANKEDIFNKLEALENIERPVGEDKIWPLVIKKFPAGTASVNTIRAYISQLRFHGFNPDFLIVDYVGEMQDYPDMKIYESREKLVKDLHGMAEEEDVFLGTAMQPNRDAKKDKGERSRIDDDHLADAYGQIRPLDGCLSLNQNDNEKLLGIGRGYIIKQRDGKSRYQIYLKFDKECLRITETTQQEYLTRMNAHKEIAAEDTKIDMIKNSHKNRKFGDGDAVDAATEATSGGWDEGSTTD